MLGIFGNFDVETRILDKIDDDNLLIHIDKMDKAVTAKNYNMALVHVNRAIDKCSNENYRVYCLYAKAVILYYDNDNNKCAKFIEDNMDDFKRVFKFASIELWRLFTMLWNCQYRQKKYFSSICSMCSLKYFSGLLQTVCYTVILILLAYNVSFKMFYLSGDFIGTVLSAAVLPVFTSAILFIFNGSFKIRKKQL